MTQTFVPRCDCCGLPISPQFGEDCPRCNYPINVSKEERYLASAIRDLQRVIDHGGGNLTIAGLASRYMARLNYLRRLQVAAQVSPVPSAQVSQIQAQAPTPFPELVPEPPVNGKSTVHRGEEASGSPSVPSATTEEGPGIRQRMFSLRSFTVDQTITLFGLLGAFLGLLGALNFVITNTGNLLGTFFVALGIHVLAGAVAVGTYRFPNFRVLSLIYTIIYALSVPLLGYTGYNLVQGHFLQLSVPELVAIEALYAAVVYGALAIYQRTALFGYPAMMCLVVLDLAIARDLNLGYWWWPGMLMLLALPALVTHHRPAGSAPSRIEQLFAGSRIVLREPVRILMFLIVATCVAGIAITTLYSLQLNGSNNEVRFSILSMTLLLLTWVSLSLWITKRTREVPVLAYLFLACVLAFGYAYDVRQVGYVLALTAVAVLYHGLNRFAPHLLQPFGRLGLQLDLLALILVALVPIVSAPLLPLQLLSSVYPPLPEVATFLRFHASWETVAELLAIGVGVMLTTSILFYRASISGRTATPGARQNPWSWLLLLTGFLVNSGYAIVVLALNLEPTWYFLGLTLLLVAGAVLVRQFFGAYWANPLDVLALGEVLLTLSLSLNQRSDIVGALLLFFAVLSYAVLLYQRRQTLLFLPFIFACAALILPSNSFWVLVWLAPVPALLAFGISRLAGRDWAAPLYIVALLGAVMMGIRGYEQQQLFATDWALLGFAILIYIIGVAEDLALFMWVAPFFATWSVFDSGLQGDLYRPPTVALICAAIGVALGRLNFWVPAIFSSRHNNVLRYALPFYATALAAAVLTGIYGMFGDINKPFYGAIPDALLVYALVAYGVLLFERRPNWLWLVAGFVVWGTLLAIGMNAYYVAGIGLGAGLVGLLLSRVVKLSWSWPWYGTALVAAIVTGAWASLSPNLPVTGFIGYGLLAFTVLAVLIMLVERRPEMLVFPVALAAWTIWQWQPPLDLVPLMVAYTLLNVLIFASQFAWKVLPPATNLLPATRLHRVLGLGGQTIVVLAIIGQNGLSADSGSLVHVGAAALLVLALLLFWYGRLQSAIALRHSCYYAAGFLLSLVVPWELSAFRQTNLSLLTLVPASYLIVLAPFLAHDVAIPERHRVGQMVSILGSALLLLPTLWLSFSEDNLRPTLILAGEAVVLMFLGIGTHVRVFVLVGSGLIVIAGLRALFLPSLGVPTSLALALLGVLLLLIATSLSLTRRRLQAAWSRWE